MTSVAINPAPIPQIPMKTGGAWPPSISSPPPSEPNKKSNFNFTQPDPLNPNKPTIILVNGVSVSPKNATERAKDLSLQMGGHQTAVVYNETQGPVADSLETLKDIQFLADFPRQYILTNGNPSYVNPAAYPLAREILGQIRQGKPVKLLAESQGSVITAQALYLVKQKLLSDNNFVPHAMRGGQLIDPGLGNPQIAAQNETARKNAEAQMAHIKVVAVNSPVVKEPGSQDSLWPNGPQYLFVVGDNDRVLNNPAVNAVTGGLGWENYVRNKGDKWPPQGADYKNVLVLSGVGHNVGEVLRNPTGHQAIEIFLNGNIEFFDRA